MLIAEKVDQAIHILREFNIDCWITFVRESQVNGDPILPFLLDADVTWHSALIISADGKTHAIVGEYDKKTVEDLGVYQSVTGYVKGFKDDFQKYMRQLNPGQMAVNYSQNSEICDGLTHGMYLTLCELLSGIGMENRLISAERVVSALRERKSPTEIGNIRLAIAKTEAIFEKIAKLIKPGFTEKQIADFMKREVTRQGLQFAWEEAVCPAVFTGPETAGAHYAPTDRTVENGHLLNMDFGVKVNGYCSDMQRTFYVLAESEHAPPPDVLHGFRTLRETVEKARRKIRPGVTGKEVDATARDYLIQKGYTEFPHGLGHQVGRFAHDGTALLGPPWEKYADKPFRMLEKGMVFTIEPRLTVPGKGVVTIEEMVVITENGAEYLTHPQKELLLISR